MSLSDLASIGSLASSLAVLISLVYVAIQIRQTERNQRTQMQQATSSRNLEAVKHWGEPAVASALLKARRGDADLTEMDLFQLTNQLRISLTSFQDAFILLNQSLIDDVQLDAMLRGIRQLLGLPVLRALWNMQLQAYSPAFVAWINAQIKDLPLREHTDFREMLKVALAELKSESAR